MKDETSTDLYQENENVSACFCIFSPLWPVFSGPVGSPGPSPLLGCASRSGTSRPAQRGRSKHSVRGEQEERWHVICHLLISFSVTFLTLYQCLTDVTVSVWCVSSAAILPRIPGSKCGKQAAHSSTVVLLTAVERWSWSPCCVLRGGFRVPEPQERFLKSSQERWPLCFHSSLAASEFILADIESVADEGGYTERPLKVPHGKYQGLDSSDSYMSCEEAGAARGSICLCNFLGGQKSLYPFNYFLINNNIFWNIRYGHGEFSNIYHNLPPLFFHHLCLVLAQISVWFSR